MYNAIALPGLPVNRMWNNYQKQLQKNPLLTKSVTSFVGFGLGDILAQSLTGSERYDLARTVRMSVYGGVIMGPLAHNWFNFLDKVVLPKHPQSPLAIVGKMFLDQVVQAPFGLSIFYAYQETLQGRAEMAPTVIQEKLLPTLLMTWKFWPLAHLVNFSVIPLEQRILYVNVVSVFYTCLLSRLEATDQVPVPELQGSFMPDLQ
eukprot:TRINITY_DN17886_c0_g1_i2.p2 TRINITY_DN17886_c0_g1~~TRINITY_DN17886_c0_g1_i2.p2  ORF type:complete len:204 (-),score=17.62 TRINITY_DN17886_c0_g1_i2:667-1278(-)